MFPPSRPRAATRNLLSILARLSAQGSNKPLFRKQQVERIVNVAHDDGTGLQRLRGDAFVSADADAERSRRQHQRVVAPVADGDDTVPAETVDKVLFDLRLLQRGQDDDLASQVRQLRARRAEGVA